VQSSESAIGRAYLDVWEVQKHPFESVRRKNGKGQGQRTRVKGVAEWEYELVKFSTSLPGLQQTIHIWMQQRLDVL
jgi:hypothetical protein